MTRFDRILSKTIGRVGDAHATICVYLVSWGLTSLVTRAIKNYVGYLRPVFYDLCVPSDDLQECTSGDDEARRSFPSGHSSQTFCGMTLLTLYLLARFGVYSGTMIAQEGPDLMTYTKPPRIKKLFSILCLAPMAVAIFVASSRVVDNKHFPADVVGGSLLGGVLAWFTHGLWYVDTSIHTVAFYLF